MAQLGARKAVRSGTVTSAGPIPLGDYGVGELLVFVFMGPIIVGGTVYVQTQSVDWATLVYSIPVAALVTAILMVNNLRDREEDAERGRHTLVTLHGDRIVRYGYVVLVVLAFSGPFAAILLGYGGPMLAIPWLTLPLAARVSGWVLSAQDRDTLHRALRQTSLLHMMFGLLLAFALFLHVPRG